MWPNENLQLEDLPGEEWRPVPGYELGYQVSNLGRIKTVPRMVNNHTGVRLAPERIRKQTAQGPRIKYWHLTLYLGEQRQSFEVHRLVLRAFVGPPPDGMESRHGVGGSLDSSLANLCYGTPQQNKHDQIAHGTWVHGERQWKAKLTAKAAAEIKSSKESAAFFAAKFNVCASTIYGVRAGKTWK